MRRRRCIVLTNGAPPPGLTTEDADEIERFTSYLRLVGEAERAGVPRDEAGAAIYPDVYPDGGGPVRANEGGQ